MEMEMVNLHVLLADDEPEIREIVDLSLGLDSLFVVRGCETGKDALAAAVTWCPDLILLDVMMPGMDGPTTLAQLRKNPRTAEIPVVFVTGRACEREQLVSLGAVGVMAKPFDLTELPSLVRAYVPAEAHLACARDQFLTRLGTDAAALTACRSMLAQDDARRTLARIKEVAHVLANRSAIYGFAGISMESAELEREADAALTGDGVATQLEPALDRVLARLQQH
jgi:two-component system, OmpR family, response regulator